MILSHCYGALKCHLRILGRILSPVDSNLNHFSPYSMFCCIFWLYVPQKHQKVSLIDSKSFLSKNFEHQRHFLIDFSSLLLLLSPLNHQKKEIEKDKFSSFVADCCLCSCLSAMEYVDRHKRGSNSSANWSKTWFIDLY